MIQENILRRQKKLDCSDIDCAQNSSLKVLVQKIFEITNLGVGMPELQSTRIEFSTINSSKITLNFPEYSRVSKSESLKFE